MTENQAFMKNSTGFWIFNENLYRVLWVMSEVVHFDFSQTDYQAISYGLIGTSMDENLYYEHLFIGADEDFYVEFARDGDWYSTDIIFITAKSNNPKTLELIDMVNTVQGVWDRSYKEGDGRL